MTYCSMRLVRWAALVLLASPAIADPVPAPPVLQTVDVNGVDVVSGEYDSSMTDVSIGPSGNHGLAFTRYWDGYGWRNSLVITISGSTPNPIVSVAGNSESFTVTGGGAYNADSGDGATLTRDSNGLYTYISRDGTTITFTQPNYELSSYGANLGYVDTIVYADGVRVKFTYLYTYACTQYSEAYGTTYCSAVTYNARLQSATNNLGYQLKLSYGDNGGISRVTAINNAVEYCDPQADSCSLGGNWAHADYGYSGSQLTAVSDAMGRQWTYHYNGDGRLDAIRRPGASVDDVAVVYGTGGPNGHAVSTVTRHGNMWNYSWGQTGFRAGLTTTTIQDPFGAARKRYVSYDAAGLVKSDINENGLETTYDYDGASRITRVTPPEGNTTLFEYDGGVSGGRGNVTKVTYQQKNAPAAPTLNTYATYPSTCSGTVAATGQVVTAANCNKPTSTTDARGKVTTYYWNTNGPIGAVTAPAMANGAHPETHYFYANAGAWYYGANGGSSLANSPYAVNLPIYTRGCRTGNWGCAASAEVRTDLVYYGGPGPTNMLVLNTKAGAGDGSLSVMATYNYDAYGNATATTDPNGHVMVRAYNLARQVSEVRSPDPDGSGPLRNRSARTTFGADGQPSFLIAGTSNADGSGFTALQYVTPVYDAYGRKWLETLSDGSSDKAQVQYSYDAVGRLECTAQRMNMSVSTTPPASACTQGTAGSFGPDRISHTVYEYAGLVDRVQTGYGTSLQRDEVHYDHNGNGQVTRVIDAKGNITSSTYDGFDRLWRTCFNTDYPACLGSPGDYEELGYDAGGNVTSRRLRDATSIGYAYDDLGQVIAKYRPNGESTVGYTYDNQGHVLTVSNGVTLTNVYDALGRLTEAHQPFGTLYYQYDAAGHRARETWGDGFAVTYCYDAAGAMTEVREAGSSTAGGCGNGTLLGGYGYDALGNRTSVTRSNGVTTSYAYDSVSRLTQIAHDLAGTADDQAIGFTGYNPAGQIMQRTSSNDVYAWTQHYNVSRGYASDALNRYASISSGGWEGTMTPSYDLKGNLTSAGPASYGYTSENLLKSASGGITLGYDGAGRLAEYNTNTTTRFVYDGGEIASEVDGAGNLLRRYVAGAGADEPLLWYEGSGTGDRRWLIADERGSIIAVTNGAGQQLAINSYDEYGIPASTNLGRFQYTGQAWLPELGLYYYKARMYSATLGRFLQTDPIGYGDGPNWYDYAHGDPVNGKDPSGTCYGDRAECDKSSSEPYLNGIKANLAEIIVTARHLLQPYFTAVTELSIGNTPGVSLASLIPMADLAATTTPQNDIVVTGKRIVQAVQNHPYIATGVALGVGALVCPECDVAEIVVTARRASWFTRLFQRIFGQACFAAGTLVQTDHGLRPIETIKPGDMVLSRDEKTGRTAYKRVTAVKAPTQDELYIVELDVPAEKEAEHHADFQATATHPWRASDGRWIATTQLRRGMKLLRSDGLPAQVEQVRDSGHKARTYNLTVEGYHTYFVGPDHLWVHNDCTKAESPIWQGFRNWRGKTRTDGSQYYEWDYTHNNIEVYNGRGSHLGVMDPLTGEMIGDPVAGRTINVR